MIKHWRLKPGVSPANFSLAQNVLIVLYKLNLSLKVMASQLTSSCSYLEKKTLPLFNYIYSKHVPKEIRKLFSKLVSKTKFMGSLLLIFMPHFQCVGS